MHRPNGETLGPVRYSYWAFQCEEKTPYICLQEISCFNFCVNSILAGFQSASSLTSELIWISFEITFIERPINFNRLRNCNANCKRGKNVVKSKRPWWRPFNYASRLIMYIVHVMSYVKSENWNSNVDKLKTVRYCGMTQYARHTKGEKSI